MRDLARALNPEPQNSSVAWCHKIGGDLEMGWQQCKKGIFIEFRV